MKLKQSKTKNTIFINPKGKTSVEIVFASKFLSVCFWEDSRKINSIGYNGRANTLSRSYLMLLNTTHSIIEYK